MLKKINKTDWIFIGLLIALLIAIRAFEEWIFYDPFIAYFKESFAQAPYPVVHPIKLFLSIGFRFYLNSIISVGILYLLFKDAKITRFSIFLYAFFGTFLMIAFFFMMVKLGDGHKMYLFYVRRFLIQPVFLLLFVPAFYYQKKIK